MTQIATSTSASALGFSTQNKVIRLFDGSYLVGYYDLAAQVVKLVQVTTPGGSPSFTTLGTTFTIASSTVTDFDLFSLDTVSSTDIWVTIASNTGGTTAVVKLSHTVYTNTGTPTFATWDALTTVPTLATSGGEISSVIWNGTYLIVAWRDNGTNYTVRLNYTTVKAGTSGWLATSSTILMGTNATAAVTHAYPILLYDPTIAATVIIYSLASAANGTEQIFYRVLPDGVSPALANWGSQGSVFGGSLNLGGGNFAASWDHTTGTIHVVWCDSTTSNTKSPGYIPSTAINTTTKVITWGTALAVGTAATANNAPAVGVDSRGTVHFFFATAATGANGTINHATAASPYTSVSSVTTFGTTTNDNNFPYIPKRERFTGFVPLLYQFTAVSPFGIQYDNSFTFASAFTSTLSAALSTSAAVVRATTRSLSGTLSFIGTQTKGATRQLSGVLSFSGTATTIRGKTQTLAAGLSFVGTITARGLTRSLSGVLSSGATLTRSSARVLAAAFSFAGTVRRTTGRPFSGTLSFIGTRSTALSRPLNAALSFVGTRSAAASRRLTASLSSIGTIARGTTKSLTAGLATTATITRKTVRALGATLASSGLLIAAKNGGTVAYTLALSGILSFSGAASRQSRRTLSGILAGGGSLQRTLTRALVGTWNASGTSARSVAHGLTAALSPVAAVTRNTARSLTAALASSGFATFLYQAGFTAYTATFTAATALSGSVSRSTTRTLASALSLTGTIQRSLGRILSAVGGFAGFLAFTGRKRPGRITGSVDQLNRIATSIAFTSQIVFSVDESSRITSTVAATSRIVTTAAHTSRIIGSVE